MIAFVFGLFGLIVGSFLNVVILRHGERSIGGRSACPSCGMQLKWYDMVPVFSWIALRGRCRSCKKSISIQYPLVEATTGILFALVGAAPIPSFFFPFDMQLLGCVIAAFFIIISVYDIRHQLIPDVWVWPLVGFAFLWMLLLTIHSSAPDYMWLLLSGPIAALPLLALWLASRGAWMGFGDVKLALAVGWLLGSPYGFVAIFFSFVLGAVISVGILLPLPHIVRAFRTLGITRLEGEQKHFTIKSEVPFGPFITLACILVWFALLYNISIPIFSYYGY